MGPLIIIFWRGGRYLLKTTVNSPLQFPKQEDPLWRNGFARNSSMLNLRVFVCGDWGDMSKIYGKKQCKNSRKFFAPEIWNIYRIKKCLEIWNPRTICLLALFLFEEGVLIQYDIVLNHIQVSAKRCLGACKKIWAK